MVRHAEAAIQLEVKAAAMVVVSVLDIGMASNHLDERSTIVKMWLNPSEERGRGPTRSIWT